jgi:hypothetical protein
MFFECDDNDINDYNNSSYEHGKLGEVETQDIEVLNEARTNFDVLDFDVNDAKEIMLKYLKENNIFEDDSDIEEFGFNCFDKTLVFKL